MANKLFFTPRFETKINRAIFTHQDLVVYPNSDKRLPDNIVNVVKFLFGEGAIIRRELSANGYPMFTIEDACYELRNVHTINADWTYQEIKENE